MRKFVISALAVVAGAGLLGVVSMASADPFTEEDVATWNAQFDSVVKEGRAAFTDPKLGGSKNGVVCAQCHPNAANTHPETYPKFQQQLGKVAVLGEMVNWCIQHPLEGEPLALDDPQMVALQAYMHWERRGVEMAPGKH